MTDVLASLRDRARADRARLEAMREAETKGDYEQESLGPPQVEGWPFYPQ